MKAIEEKEQAKKEKVKQQEERKQRIEQRKKQKAEQAEERRKKIEVKKQNASQLKHTQDPGQRKARKAQKDGKGPSKSNKTERLPFTEDEIKRFETRFENGYDLKNDERYNVWLKTRKGESEPLHQAGG